MEQVQSKRETDTAIFVSRDRVFSVRDVIDAAHFRGDLKRAWSELLQAVECEQKAAESDLRIDEAGLQAMAERFRYERDLITEEETEQWLEKRGLTLDDFSDYFGRRYWVSTLGRKLAPPTVEYSAASPEVRDLLRVELFFSDEFAAAATALTWRVAARAAAEGEPERPTIDAERTLFLARIGEATPTGWLALLGRGESWLEEMLRTETIYRAECERLLTEETCRQEMETARLGLTRFDLEIVELESIDAAREALLCIREDGISPSELADECSYPYRRTKLFLEDLPDEWQQRFLCASSGDVLEPLARDDGFELYAIVEKIDPHLAENEVRSRLERRILRRHFSGLAAKHIRWVLAPNGT